MTKRSRRKDLKGTIKSVQRRNEDTIRVYIEGADGQQYFSEIKRKQQDATFTSEAFDQLEKQLRDKQGQTLWL